MSTDPGDLPPRRRDSWSLRKIAEEIGGAPIDAFQEPGRRAIAPYPRTVAGSLPRRPGRTGPGTNEPTGPEDGPPGGSADDPLDPVHRVYPPLTRATGRALHGVDREHHAETLATVRAAPEPPVPGHRPHLPGPSTRPERVYLHYLLLHLDRLSDHALLYLQRAVSEEVEARAPPPPA